MRDDKGRFKKADVNYYEFKSSFFNKNDIFMAQANGKQESSKKNGLFY